MNGMSNRPDHVLGESSQFHRVNGSSSGGGRRTSADRVRFQLREKDTSNPWDPLLFLCTSILVIVCTCGLATVLGVLYLTVRPFSQRSYRRLAAHLGAASFLDATAVLLPNTRILLTADSDVPSPVGVSLMVSNHVVDADWWAMLMLGRCVGLRGTLKIFLRNEYLRVDAGPASDQSSTARRKSGVLVTSSSLSRIVTSVTRTDSGNGSPSSSSSSSPGSPSRGTASGGGSGGGGNSSGTTRRLASQDVTVSARLLHRALEFPLINGEDQDRNQLFQLLRSFIENNGASSSPVHLLLFPESWSVHQGSDRKSIHAKSNEFAKREGRPQLKHLLLPRTRGFKACLECLRESSPVVYDVTMAYNGYDGSLPPCQNLSILTLWNHLRNKFPREIHLRIKRYSMEEVLQDSSWLDKKWAEKDRLLSQFARHQSFPVDSRLYGRPMIFDSRLYSLESSTVALIRLLLLPCAVPILLMLSFPLFCSLGPLWLAHAAYRKLTSHEQHQRDRGGRQPGSAADGDDDDDAGGLPTPGSASNTGTPYCPATPFGSPAATGWNGMFSSSGSSGRD